MEFRKVLSTGLIVFWAILIGYLRFFEKTADETIHFRYTLWTVLLFLALWAIVRFCSGFGQFKKLSEINEKMYRKLEELFSDRVILLFFWGLSFLVFLAAFIAYYPGIFGYDAPIQFGMFHGVAEFSTHHPVYHTLFIGGVIQLGYVVFHSYQAGFVLLVLIQGIIISECMARMVVFLKRRRIFLPVILLGLAWVFLNPFLQILSCNVTKDVLFGIFVSYFFMSLMDVTEMEQPKRIDCFRLVFTGILVCLFRKGMVLPMVMVCLCCVLCGLHRKKMIFSFAILIVTAQILLLVPTQFFRISKGATREFLSVPIQQMAFLIYLEGKQIELVKGSAEEKQFVCELFSDVDRIISEYCFDCADLAKGMFNEEYARENLKETLLVYMNLVIQNPDACFKAWCYLVHPYFYMNSNNNRGLMFLNTFEQFYQDEPYRIHRDSKYLTFYRQYLDESVLKPVRWWYDFVVPLTFLGLLTCKSIRNNEKTLAPALLFLWIYFVGLMLAPIALYRYSYPLAVATPLLIGLTMRRSSSACLQQ